MEELREIKLLGSGAFGKCYLCIDPKDKSKVVVKQIDISTMDLKEKEEAYHEAKIMSAFNHPNIIKFRDVHTTTNGKLNIVMDYADGGDLSEKIKGQKGAFFSEGVILDIFVQLCLAMKHVHDRKILHRDIKAQNIFLMQNGIVKLGDFGIARVLTNTMDKAKTAVGTPYYLSPEIVDNKPYNFKSDVWSLGVLLYELCTLKPPFDGSSFHFLALKIVRGAYPPLPTHYTRDLKSLVSLMLSVDPNKRPTIASILKLNFINKRIQKLLSQSVRLEEFSHTVLHNQQSIDPDVERPCARQSDENKKAPEEFKSRPKSKNIEKNPKKNPEQAKIKEKPQKNLSVEDKNKLREEKAKKREEDRIKMKQDIKAKKGKKDKKDLIVWFGLNVEENRLIEELQQACNDTETPDQEVIPLNPSEEEMVVKEDIITHYIPIDPAPKPPESVLSHESKSSADPVLDTLTPERSDHDRMELLRVFLERNLGEEVFIASYKLLKQFIATNQQDWDYENIYQQLKGLMKAETAKQFIPLLHTLIFLEGESDNINIE
jgi:serine/threonine protein kinase